MPMNAEYRDIAELPGTIPVFPLPEALLLPRGQMPLIIFEPRYIAMVDDALAGRRAIGMIQPSSANPSEGSTASPPALYEVGCLGRITQFAETGDGRYQILLTGIARFRVREELTVMTPYRQCGVDYAPFEIDLKPRAGEDEVDRKSLIKALRDFSEASDVQIDWDNVKEAPNESLVNALAMMSPYGAKEKQALLEAVDLKTRADILVAITEIELAKQESGSETRMQ